VDTDTFKDYLIKLSNEISLGNASVAMVSTDGNMLQIAAAGEDAAECMQTLLVAAQQQWAIPEGATVN
jgi:hypothetical protein